MTSLARLSVTVLAILLALSAVRGNAADQARLLEVIVNGYSTNKIGEFVLRNDALFAKPSELHDLGFKIDESVPRSPDGLIALSTLEGVSSTIDEATQKLYVKASVAALLPALLKTDGGAVDQQHVEEGTGVTVNYDMNGTFVSGKSVGTGAFSLRGYSPLGLLSTNALAFVRSAARGSKSTEIIRLDSTYAFSDPDQLLRVYAGDTVTNGLSWTRPVRLGGIKFSSDFSLEPQLVSFPLPALAGAATTPSMLDVLVNGTPVLSQPIQPGPFQIPHVPVTAGAGSIAMRLTDAAGQSSMSTISYYASTSLIAEGLQSYSVELGKLRENYGLESNDYGDLAGSATYRRGITSSFTIEAHGEGTRGIFTGGVAGIATLAEYCVANASVAASGGQNGGIQFALGVQHVSTDFSSGVLATFSSRGFNDLASALGDPVPVRSITFNDSLSLGLYGTIGVAYSIVDDNALPLAVKFLTPTQSFAPISATGPGSVASIANGIASFQQNERAHVASANYSLRIGNTTLLAMAFRDLAGGSTGIMLGLTIPLGDKSSAFAETGSGSNGGYEQVQAELSPTQIGDWGYRVMATAGDHTEEYGEASYQSRWALLSGGADRLANVTSVHADAQGAVSYADGSVFASNKIPDAFAIVDTDGMKDVEVMNENNVIGRTDSSGHLIVTSLRSFDTNHLAINPTDVPLDASVDTDTAEVKPADHAGVIVHFRIRASHGALVKLVDQTNAPIPVGSTATLNSSGQAVSVGFDGEAFVEDLTATGNELAVERPNGKRCEARFTYSATPGEIPTIGPVVCVEEKP